MCGYQGWFRTPTDGAEQGWAHYAAKGPIHADNLHIDLWPDMSEYEKTYATPFHHSDGSTAHLFSSYDESTTDLHFRWMKDYGIDGVFVQRFFAPLKTERGRHRSRVVLEHALTASKKYDRAIAVMYDLSGLSARGEDCSAIIQDWKELVDQLKITSGGDDQTYLYHRGKPLVAIWGLGFYDRPYQLGKIGIEKVIDFLKNDPVYGGCAVMLGVPTYFRELDIDCLPDPYLHDVIEQADIVMPWTVQRFTPLLHKDAERFASRVKADQAWCNERKVDYVPCVYPGFSWYNLGKTEFNGEPPLNQIPRQKGAFYWSLVHGAISAGAKMLYVAMFDEMDEGTAIFKCSNTPPIETKVCDYEGMPSDHYLWLTGLAGKALRREVPLSTPCPLRDRLK